MGDVRLKAGGPWVRVPMRSFIFLIYVNFQQHHGTGVCSESGGNEYRKIFFGGGGKARPVLGADNLAAICEPID
jgi:hypothetical protein